MNAAPPAQAFAIPLDSLELGKRAHIQSIDWPALEEAAARRLRQFGFDDGVTIEALHSGPFGRDPLAVRVGRMTVAIRRAHARAVHVIPIVI